MSRLRVPRRIVGAFALTLLLGPALGAVADEPLRAADRAWERRADGADGDRPRPGPIRESIRRYASVLEQHPDGLEARWKLLRSLHFAGEFVADTPEATKADFDRGTRVSEEGLRRLPAEIGPDALDGLALEEIEARVEGASVDAEDVARLYFWSAIHWGAWSRTVGLLSAVREGVAGRLHRYTRVALALEPGYDGGGPYRLLGRLHAVLPRIPFLSGWVDRERALPLIEQGLAAAPEHPGNALLLGLTLLDLAPDRRDEAIARLREVAALEPRPSMRIEDLRIQDQAQEKLSEIEES